MNITFDSWSPEAPLIPNLTSKLSNQIKEERM